MLARTIPAPVPPSCGAGCAEPACHARPATHPFRDPAGDRAAEGVRPRRHPGRRAEQIGLAHRNTLVDIHVDEAIFDIYNSVGEQLAPIPKTTTKDVSRYKAYGWRDNIG